MKSMEIEALGVQIDRMKVIIQDQGDKAASVASQFQLLSFTLLPSLLWKSGDFLMSHTPKTVGWVP